MTIVRKAAIADLPPVLGLLRDASLPHAGVREHFNEFLVAEDAMTVVGAIGMEVYADVALLRSAVVRDDLRGRGIGGLLTDALLNETKKRGIRRIVLLTTTAEGYFASKGFRKIDRSGVGGPVTASAEFTGACPSTAVCMEMIIS